MGEEKQDKESSVTRTSLHETFDSPKPEKSNGNIELALQQVREAAKAGKVVSPSRIMEALSSGPGLAGGLEVSESGKEHMSGTAELLRRTASALWNPEIIAKRLMRETSGKGIRNSDLSQLTGWPTSKVSKVTSGKQKLTEEDVKTWAMVLGYTADAFVQKEYDLREYRLRDHVRPVADCFESFLGADDQRAGDMIQYELPLSILSTLGVTISDYMIKTKERCILDEDIDDFEPFSIYSVMFIQKNLYDSKDTYPIFGYWVDTRQKSMVLAVIINDVNIYLYSVDEEISEEDREENAVLRQRMKALTSVSDFETNTFDEFIRTWDDIPYELKNLEISSVTYSLCNLPGREEMEADLHRIFKVFCDVAWEMTGTDLAPAGYRVLRQERMSPMDMYNILSGAGPFPGETIQAVRERQSYKCEIDSSHPSFTDDTGNPYMEVVPLVPFHQGTSFGMSIFGKENGVCLCPLCSLRLLHGTREDREDMIFKLFRKHSKGLKKVGIEISLGQLLSAYNL